MSSYDPPQGPVLVVGGAGYIGSHTVRRLQADGVDVVVLDNLSTGHRESVTATLEEVDLCDRAELERVFREHQPVAVIHFAAKCYVGESVEDPAKYYRENVTFTWNLLEAMRAAECRDIVFSSSCATYGEPVRVPMDEDHPQHPINPYGRTKLHMEHMMQDYSHAYGIRFAALRYFNAAGSSQEGDIGEVHEPETHLIPLVLQVAMGKREEILMFGDDYDTPDGTCIRDYIHVEDLADAHVRALGKLQDGTSTLACNLGTGTGFSVLEVVQAAREVTGHAIPARVVDRRPGDPAELVSGGTRAKELLGWEPARPGLSEIIGDAWQFLSRHQSGLRRMTATLTVLGAGSILPRAGYGCSGYALRAGPGEPVTLLDCGPGSVRSLGAVGIGLEEVNRVVLSHFHTDHCLDLFTLGFARRNPYHDPIPPLERIGPRGLLRMTEGAPEVLGSWVVDPRTETREVDPDADFVAGGHRFRSCPTRHTPESLAWRVDLAGGESLLYTGDTGENPDVAALGEGVDLFVAECSFPDDEGVEHHLTPSSAARLARDAGARVLLLTHFYPNSEPEEAREVAARTFNGPIELARDGAVVPFG